MTTTEPRQCPLNAAHAPHDYDRFVDGAGKTLWCLGVEHNHEKRCCWQHNHHVIPHKGCVLR